MAADQAELAGIVRQSYADGVAIYPIGGGTSLTAACRLARLASGLSLEKLNRVVDYPSRDMTITVEAGIRMADLPRRWPPRINGCRSTCRKPTRPRSGALWPRTAAARADSVRGLSATM